RLGRRLEPRAPMSSNDRYDWVSGRAVRQIYNVPWCVLMRRACRHEKKAVRRPHFPSAVGLSLADGDSLMPPNIAGNWSPHDIDHRLLSAPKSDWAWEFLRRNTEYRRAAAGAQCETVRLKTIDVAVPVFRLNRHQEAAQNWALCSFRRPNPLRKHRFRLLERRSPTVLGAGPYPARASRCRPPTRSRYRSVGYRP